MVQHVLALFFGYFCGAIPTGALVGRLYGRVDLTAVGSRRTGATNVLRTLGPGAAAAVLMGDLLKGGAAVLLAAMLSVGDPWAMALAGTAAVVGHAYSPFIGFKGGRGVATGMGSLAIIAPAFALVALLVGAATIAVTRYVSLGSMVGASVGAVSLALWTLASGQPVAFAVFALATSGFIVVAHRDNVERLLKGTERRLGERA